MGKRREQGVFAMSMVEIMFLFLFALMAMVTVSRNQEAKALADLAEVKEILARVERELTSAELLREGESLSEMSAEQFAEIGDKLEIYSRSASAIDEAANALGETFESLSERLQSLVANQNEDSSDEEIRRLKMALRSLRQMYDDLRKERNALSELAEQLDRDLMDLKILCQSREQETEIAKADVRQAEGKLVEISGELNAAVSELEALRTVLSKLQTELATLKSELSKQQLELAAKDRKIAELEDILARRPGYIPPEGQKSVPRGRGECWTVPKLSGDGSKPLPFLTVELNGVNITVIDTWPTRKDNEVWELYRLRASELTGKEFSTAGFRKKFENLDKISRRQSCVHYVRLREVDPPVQANQAQAYKRMRWHNRVVNEFFYLLP